MVSQQKCQMSTEATYVHIPNVLQGGAFVLNGSGSPDPSLSCPNQQGINWLLLPTFCLTLLFKVCCYLVWKAHITGLNVRMKSGCLELLGTYSSTFSASYWAHSSGGSLVIRQYWVLGVVSEGVFFTIHTAKPATRESESPKDKGANKAGGRDPISYGGGGRGWTPRVLLLGCCRTSISSGK